MPTDGKTQMYGFLDQLSTEQLLDLLRDNFDSLEGGESELTSRILEVMEKREEKEPTGLFSNVDQAWEDFQKYYNTPDREVCPNNPMRDSSSVAAEGRLKKRRGHGRLLRRLLPVAAVAAVTFSSMVAAQAFGFDVFGALARWTEETFQFISGTPKSAGSTESEAIRQTIQEVFDSYGVTVPAPAWYPEGTELTEEIEVKEYSGTSLIMCNLTYGDKKIHIEVQQYYKNDRVPKYTFEKDASNIEEYSSNGRLFYIMSNLSSNRTVYSNDQTVISITGTLSLETLKQIIDSIGA